MRRAPSCASSLWPMQPNVVVIVLDSARRDALEPYGASPGSSPAIGRLAALGGAAPHAYAPASWTLPSHASMFTGLLPRQLGLTQAPNGSPQSARPAMEAVADRLLPVVLKNAGYETKALSTNLWLRPESGFAQGFEEFEVVDTRRHARMEGRTARDRLRWRLEALQARADDGAADAARIFERWSRDAGQKPFFWFVNLVECHSPYLPPKPFNDLGPIERWRSADEASEYLTMAEIWRACAGALEVPNEALDRMRRLYAGAIRYLDDWVDQLMANLDRAGKLEETIVIVTADHGENFFEDGYMAHAFTLDQRLIHVPFVVVGPGSENLLPEGAFSLRELPLLIARAAGIVDHPWRGDDGEGIAVAEFNPPATIDHPKWQQRIAEWGVSDAIGERVATRLTAATDGQLKLRRRDEHEDLFEISSDADETTPLDQATVDPGSLARLRSAIHQSLSADGDPVHDDANPKAASAEEIAELEDRMKLLGYL